MEREALHPSAHAVHEDVGPVVVIIAGTAGYLEQTVAVVVAAVGGVAAVEVGVVFGAHAAATSPALVAHAEVFHLPGLVASVLPAQACHGRIALGGHVFHPLGQLLDRAAAHVSADVGLAAQHLAEVQELVRAEAVVLDGAAPVVVHHLRALLAGTDAVHPVVFVGKAAAGPAQDGHAELLQGVEHVGAVALDVGYRRVLAHPQAAVDAGAQVFGKLAVDFFRNDLVAAVGLHGKVRAALCGERQRGGQQQAAEEEFVCHGIMIFKYEK